MGNMITIYDTPEIENITDYIGEQRGYPVALELKDIDTLGGGARLHLEPPFHLEPEAAGLTRHGCSLYGNVVAASHGETQPEKILGNGDASRTHQRFALPADDISWVADAAFASGVRADLDLRVGAGERVALVGPSGSGKTLFLRALADLDRAAEIITAQLAADPDLKGVFASNLTDLLMAPPFGGKPLLAIDPGLRTGCKVVILGETGALREQPHVEQVAAAQPDLLARQYVGCDDSQRDRQLLDAVAADERLQGLHQHLALEHAGAAPGDVEVAQHVELGQFLDPVGIVVELAGGVEAADQCAHRAAGDRADLPTLALEDADDADVREATCAASQTEPSWTSPSPMSTYVRNSWPWWRAPRAMPRPADRPMPSEPVEMSMPGSLFMSG